MNIAPEESPTDEAVIFDDCSFLSFDLPSDPDRGNYEGLGERSLDLHSQDLHNLLRYVAANTDKDLRGSGEEEVVAFLASFSDPNEPVDQRPVGLLKPIGQRAAVLAEDSVAIGIFARTVTDDVGSLLYWSPVLDTDPSQALVERSEVELARSLLLAMNAHEWNFGKAVDSISAPDAETALRSAVLRLTPSGSTYHLRSGLDAIDLSSPAMSFRPSGLSFPALAEFSIGDSDYCETELSVVVPVSRFCPHPRTTDILLRGQKGSLCKICGEVASTAVS